MTIITLLTDFGTKDPYVGQMKGVILESCPDCQIVDVTHEVERHNLLMGSFLLESTASYFPEGTVHVAVVDPGVGSRRLPIVVKCKHAVLVGPDNGLLARAGRKLGFQAVYTIKRSDFMRGNIADTFHGRDIFAKTAAMIAAGHRPEEVGPRIPKLAELNVPEPKVERGVLKCCVLHVDIFGNVITNAPNDLIGKIGGRFRQLKVQAKKGDAEARIVRAYSDVGRGELAVLEGSQEYVELAVREGSASELLGVKPMDVVRVRLAR